MGQHRDGHRHRRPDNNSAVLHHEGEVHRAQRVLHYGMNCGAGVKRALAGRRGNRFPGALAVPSPRTKFA